MSPYRELPVVEQTTKKETWSTFFRRKLLRFKRRLKVWNYYNNGVYDHRELYRMWHQDAKGFTRRTNYD